MEATQGRQERWMLAGLGLFALALLGLLSLVIWRQVDRLGQLHAAEDELAPLVAQQTERNEQLQEQLSHVSSADYPEAWARVNAGMTREGEIRLVVATPVVPAAPPPPAEPVVSDPLSLWERLEQWLFGSP